MRGNREYRGLVSGTIPARRGHTGQLRVVSSGSHGSSPRGRGTRRVRVDHPAPHRFIPAWAGNTGRATKRTAGASVHPRVGGEHARLYHSTGQKYRFIPAWAGNTRIQSSATRRASVHPRVGGEHYFAPQGVKAQNGSSPRGRGTLELSMSGGENQRFIPAWAGNTTLHSFGDHNATVHPRVGGEHGEPG